MTALTTTQELLLNSIDAAEFLELPMKWPHETEPETC